ncbi:MAG: ATP-dependent DNA ligase [Microbacteriaceae bacterium]
MADTREVVTVEGRRITLTNLDKVMYPDTGTTKADVLAYYAAIAPHLIRHARNRPATRKRWVHGVGTADQPGEMFFQKNLDSGTPSWVARHTIEHTRGHNQYPLVNDLATLTWLGQIAALEIHVPQWQFDRNGKQQNPDRLVLDLDPGPGVGLAECVEVATMARAILADMGMDPIPVTSGSKGIHLYAALDGTQSSAAVSDVAHELARVLEADHPELVVSDMKKSLRHGKVLVDWSQNNAAKTTIAPYSLRGRTRPTVAVPRTWRELASGSLEQLDYEQVMKRMRRRADPLAKLTIGEDRLAPYRAKRDRAKTPEPVPELAAVHSDERSFVVQEHHARRLHYDFRLERDGVLVSWAVPKGLPTEPDENHLAVQTEDHPLEYGGFTGDIPKGEYGAGSVSIWDAGTYDLEKWRDGKEIIVTLHGRPGGGLGGSRRFALIHTGESGKAAQNWLMHLMKPDVTGAATSSTRTPAPVSGPRVPVPKAPAPMLATLGSAADLNGDQDWAYEMKWDGIRAIARIEAGSATLHSRNGNDVTVSYPEIANQLADDIASDVLLDGEIVALNAKGRPDFGLLQTRMKLTAKRDVQRAIRSVPVQYMVFDILHRDGLDVTPQRYDRRRSILAECVRSRDRIQLPPAFEGELDDAMTSSHALGLEGVMAKKRDSTYRIGRRSRAWIKLKHHATQEVVIGGWRPGKGRRSGSVGSLLLGIPGGDGLRYVGKVGTGFSDSDLDDLLARLSRLARKTTPFFDIPRADAADARWVTPSLVGEVEFAEWTTTGRLRQSSWRGLRPDKSAAQVEAERVFS